METAEAVIAEVPIESLTIPDWCPLRVTATQLDSACQMLLASDATEPIVASRKSGNVLYGVVFYKAARRLNRTHYPVVYVDVDGESAERTLMLGLHKISGSWDNDALKSILETLRNDGAAGDIGFSREDLSRLLDTVKLPEKVRIKSDVKVTVHIGKLRLEIPANKYEEWWLNLCSECGSTNNADVLEYIIKKLGL